MTRLLSFRQLYPHGLHDLDRYLILQGEYVFKLPVVVLAPNVTTSYCIDKLSCDPHPITRLLEAPSSTYRTPKSSATF